MSTCALIDRDVPARGTLADGDGPRGIGVDDGVVRVGGGDSDWGAVGSIEGVRFGGMRVLVAYASRA